MGAAGVFVAYTGIILLPLSLFITIILNATITIIVMAALAALSNNTFKDQRGIVLHST